MCSKSRKGLQEAKAIYALLFILAYMAFALVSAAFAGERASPLSASQTPTSLQSPVSQVTGSRQDESYLLAGLQMFRSRELRKAREAFEKVLELAVANAPAYAGAVAQANYFLGLIEYEEGNIEKAKTRFQTAYDIANTQSTSKPLADAMGFPSAEQVQLEFRGYEARVYYKDGWYVIPKKRLGSPILDSPSARNSDPVRRDSQSTKRRDSQSTKRREAKATGTLLTLEAGSKYRIRLGPAHKEPWVRGGIVGLMVVLSFLLSR